MWCLSVFSGIGRSDVVFSISGTGLSHTTGLMWCLSVFSGIGRSPLISPYTRQV